MSQDICAYFFVAAGCSHLQVLSLSIAVRWLVCRSYPDRCSSCYTIPKSISIEPRKDPQAQNRQHDRPEACVEVLALCPKSCIHDTVALCRSGLYLGIRWRSHQLHGAHDLRGGHRLLVKPRYRGVQRHHHGNLRHFGPPARNDWPTSACSSRRDRKEADQFFVLSTCDGGVCHLTGFRLPHCSRSYRNRWCHREAHWREGGYRSGRWYTAGTDVVAHRRSHTFQDCADNSNAAIWHCYFVRSNKHLETGHYRSS